MRTGTACGVLSMVFTTLLFVCLQTHRKRQFALVLQRIIHNNQKLQDLTSGCLCKYADSIYNPMLHIMFACNYALPCMDTVAKAKCDRNHKKHLSIDHQKQIKPVLQASVFIANTAAQLYYVIHNFKQYAGSRRCKCVSVCLAGPQSA